MPLPHLHCDCSCVSPKANVDSQRVHPHCQNIGHYPEQSLLEMVQNMPWRRRRRDGEGGSGRGKKRGGGGKEEEAEEEGEGRMEEKGHNLEVMQLPKLCGENTSLSTSQPAVAPNGCLKSQHTTDNGGRLIPKVVVTHTSPLTSSTVKDFHCTFINAIGALHI